MSLKEFCEPVLIYLFVMFLYVILSIGLMFSEYAKIKKLDDDMIYLQRRVTELEHNQEHPIRNILEEFI